MFANLAVFFHIFAIFLKKVFFASSENLQDAL